jgi:hypothetical protein
MSHALNFGYVATPNTASTLIDFAPFHDHTDLTSDNSRDFTETFDVRREQFHPASQISRIRGNVIDRTLALPYEIGTEREHIFRRAFFSAAG